MRKYGVPVERSSVLVLFIIPSEKLCGFAKGVPTERESCPLLIVAIVPHFVLETSHRASRAASTAGGRWVGMGMGMGMGAANEGAAENKKNRNRIGEIMGGKNDIVGIKIGICLIERVAVKMTQLGRAVRAVK